jgi:hypothetical protein
MRKLKITAEFLARVEIGACRASRKYFRRVYPKGIEVTDNQHENFRIGQDHNATGAHILGGRAALPEHCTTLDDFAWLTSALRDHNECFGRVCCAPHLSTSQGGEFALAGELADAVGIYLEKRKA